MNPHAPQLTSPLAAVRSAFVHRRLIFELTRREVLGKYKGSVLGILWSVFNPLALLGVYTFVFSVVLNVRWGIQTSQGHDVFALVLFVGMMIHSFFSECVSKSPGLIIENATFVKKVVFPLEVLPLSTVLTALFHLAVSWMVFLVAWAFVVGAVPLTAPLFVVTLMPAVLFTLGLVWMFSSVGVFFRDLGQFVSLIVILFLFLSPVFYPASALPARFQGLIALNPLSFPIESGRRVLIAGLAPEWSTLGFHLLIGAAVACAGFWWFQKTRKGFGDVV